MGTELWPCPCDGELLMKEQPGTASQAPWESRGTTTSMQCLVSMAQTRAPSGPLAELLVTLPTAPPSLSPETPTKFPCPCLSILPFFVSSLSGKTASIHPPECPDAAASEWRVQGPPQYFTPPARHCWQVCLPAKHSFA